MTLDMSEHFTKKADLEINEAPDGYVIYQSEPDRVHFLNATAAVVLELCDGSQSLQEISDFLKAAYELDDMPMAEFQEAVSNLVNEGLIEPCNR